MSLDRTRGVRQRLITDTLIYASPYSQSLKRAAALINERSNEVVGFTEEMRTALDALMGDAYIVSTRSFSSLPGWLFCEISKVTDVRSHEIDTVGVNVGLAHHLVIEQSFWATQLRFQLSSNHWLIGQPGEARFWSKSKARLLALQLHEAGLFISDAELA
jgi:hypothetical protein